MNADRHAGRWLAGLATVALVVAGCAAGSAGRASTGPAAPGTAPPTAAPTASLPPSPPGSSERTWFTGTASGVFPGGLSETTEGGFATYVGTYRITYVTSDPRASGTETGELTMLAVDMPDGYTVNKWFMRECADFALTNAEGAWRCTEAFGADMWDPTGDIHSVHTAAYTGEGGYAGLRMRLFAAQGTTEPEDASAEFIVHGWIEPAE